MDAILSQVIGFADRAHGDQQRKYADEPYIEHPIRVMKLCRERGYPLPVLAAAVLHDVLEDTDTDTHAIKEFLLSVIDENDAQRTLQFVIALTDVYIKSDYPRLSRRKRKAREAERLSQTSAEAQTIKYADIIDNCREIVEQDTDFAPVFLKECRQLLNKMENGDVELRRQATSIVEKGIEGLQAQPLES